MPRYTIVGSPTYIGSVMRQIGEVVEYPGWPGSTLDPVKEDSVAVRIKAAFVEARAKGKKLPRTPDLAQFADPAPKPEKPAKAAETPVKDE